MKRPVLTYLFFFCLVLITAACKDDRLPASPIEKEGGSNVYVSIVVNTEDSQNSRVSTPAPGEDGDSPQIGVKEENVVHDECILLSYNRWRRTKYDRSVSKRCFNIFQPTNR